MKRLPPDLYGDDDGDVACYPGGTRNQARAVAAGFWGRTVRIRADRVYLRAMTDEEKQERGFGACGICAIACPQDHPEAQAGWRLECGEGPNALTAPS